jgi:hypothetical protein
MSAKKKAKARASKRAAKKSPKRASAAKPARMAKRAAKPVAKAKAKAKPVAKARAKAKVAKVKPVAKAKAKAKAKKNVVVLAPRRDGTGHLDPKYAKDLLRRSRESSPPKGLDRAFLDGPQSDDGLAENLGEDFVEMATSGEDDTQDRAGAEVPEEVGGPFVETTGGTEFASGTDASNPADAKREPFPTT